MRRLAFWTVGVCVVLALFAEAPDADADPIVPVPGPPTRPGGGALGGALSGALGVIGGGRGGGAGGSGASGAGIGGNESGPGGGGIFSPDFGISNPGAPAIFLCPGVGAAGGAVGGGGGYCDFDFIPVKLSATTEGVGHIHCEWGGFTPLLTVWNCWRVWPGQPDHPKLPDPDIIPDGWGVPFAIAGPTPNDVWPPPGLAPAGQVGPPPPPAPEVVAPPAPLPPGPPGLPAAPPGPVPVESAPVPFGQPVGPPPGPFNPPGPPPP